MDFDDFKILGTILLLVALSIAGCVGLVSMDCKAYSEATGRDTKMVFGSCYVQTEAGVFIPREEFNYRATTNEGR